MSRVLIVDDEPDYRDELQACLARDGHEVRTAGSAREAIDVGLCYRPGILVVDWMLRSPIHGLHVADVLRTVSPELQTIVITGYATDELKREAAERHVSLFLEKPFELQRLQDAVTAAATPLQAERFGTPLPVLDLSESGRILYANRAARDLLGTTVAGADAGYLRDLFDVAELTRLHGAVRDWVAVTPRLADAAASAPATWYVRLRRATDEHGWLAVVLPSDARRRTRQPVVRMLLDLPDARFLDWPLDIRALIVEPSPDVRRVLAAQFEAAGTVAHLTADPRRALPLLLRDAEIGALVIDGAVDPRATAELVNRTQALRPGVRIVGTGSHEAADAFIELGVADFLPKPWSLDRLVRVLAGRLGECAACGLPIPLRRTRDNEQPTAWECCGCGAGIDAVFDEDFPSEVIRNVRPRL